VNKHAQRWTYTVGLNPHRVTAFEDVKRGGVVTLRWHIGAGVTRKRMLRSLGFAVRGARGGIDRDLLARAIAAADAQYAALVAGKVSATVVMTPTAPLTITQGWERAKHPQTGKWNKDTAHRRDMDRAIKNAVKMWGPAFTWAEVDRGQIRKLWREELKRLRKGGHAGVRGAQLQLDLVLAIAEWLRDEQLIPSTAALRWKQMDAEFTADAGDHTPSRPRYTVEEYRKLFAAAWQADERYGLLYDLGAEGRLGQVARAMRSHLDAEHGRLRVIGRGKKKGTVIVCTAAQKANVTRVLETGYLAGLETAYRAGTIPDYPIFPGGHFARDKDTGRLVSRAEYANRAPVDRTAWRSWHEDAEKLAGIPHVKGRGPYGSRRAGVDGAKELKISREGLQSWGGWADSQTPDAIYADQEQEYARDEASEIRAKVRGELQESSQIIATPADSPSATISPEEHTDA
jgi:integrase